MRRLLASISLVIGLTSCTTDQVVAVIRQDSTQHKTTWGCVNDQGYRYGFYGYSEFVPPGCHPVGPDWIPQP